MSHCRARIRFHASESWHEVVLLVYCIALLATAGCRRHRESDWSTNPPSASSIRATNKVRQEHGVRQIKKTWIFYGREFRAEKWKDEKGQRCKVVCYNDDRYHEIQYEGDYYFSGARFPSHDPDGGISREFLSISYFYAAKRFAIAVVTDNKEIESMVKQLTDAITYPTKYGSYGGYGAMGKTNEETLRIAEKILQMWGQSRL